MEQKTNISETEAKAYFGEEFLRIINGKGDFALALCQDEDAHYCIYSLLKTKQGRLYSSVSHTIDTTLDAVELYADYYTQKFLSRHSFYVQVHTDIFRETVTVVFYDHLQGTCEPVDIIPQEEDRIDFWTFNSCGKPGFVWQDKKSRLSSLFIRDNGSTICGYKDLDLRAVYEDSCGIATY